MPVGGSRHYTGSGLGATEIWRCPGCGSENAGPLEQGCSSCGAGRPGTRVDTPPPVPPAALDQPPASAPASSPTLDSPGSQAVAWARAHPEASLEQAYLAGYIAASRERAPQLEESRMGFSPEGKTGRTIVAALELFRDQILSANPEEVQQGEWLSATEVAFLIRQLRQQLPAEEAIHG